MRCIDLTNKKFGRLTVIKRDGHEPNGNARWQCRCDCGNIVEVDGYRLRHGGVRSCGCLRREVSKARSKRNPVFIARQRTHGEDLFDASGISYVATRTGRRNKSGQVGVSFNKSSQSWFARMWYHGEYVLLKSCSSYEEAVWYRKQAESQYLNAETYDQSRA